MDKCGNCQKPAAQLFETGKEGVYHCFKCQPLVPEVTIGDAAEPEPEPQTSNTDEACQATAVYCIICHKSFQKSTQLQNHLRNHRAERRFVCTYCNKAFSQSNNLRAHLRIHTNERPYKCSECGKAFTQVTNLNNHVRLHTGERPFACPEPGCDKAYAQVTNLNQHRKRHLSGRPMESSYDCTVCGERFTQRYHMYTHRRVAHAETHGARRGGGAAGAGAAGAGAGGQFPCRVCSARLTSERMLRLHLAHNHPDASSDDADDDHGGEGEGEGDSGEGGEGGEEGRFPCVFPSCGVRVSSPRAHTEHLLRAHQLRVLAAARPPPRRGRPPKGEAWNILHHAAPIWIEGENGAGGKPLSDVFTVATARRASDKVLKDPLEIPEIPAFDEVKIIKEEPQYVPKLKVQSLFQ